MAKAQAAATRMTTEVAPPQLLSVVRWKVLRMLDTIAKDDWEYVAGNSRQASSVRAAGDQASSGLKMIEANLEGLVKKGAMTQDKMNNALSLLKGVLDYSEFKAVDMVIEKVVHVVHVPLKQSIFSEIEKACPSHCILATNTSTIDLNLVGAKTRSQDRIVDAHFFRLQDVAGSGAALAVKEEFAAAFKGQTFESGLVELMVKSGRHGKINGKGYYIYEKGSKPRPDPGMHSVIEESRRRVNIMPAGKPITVSDQEILEMIFFPVVNEACRVMDEGVVVQASDLDIASVLGMGFPRYWGGLVFWADSIGSGYIHASLSRWAETYGDFFKPSQYLEERAKKGMPLSVISPASSHGSKARL